MTRATIIVPALNAEATLDAALASACAQTERDLDVVVVDDGSTDGTAALVDRWAEADDRVVLLRHPHRRGVSAARNTALRAAKGEWAAVLDADDRFAPERVETLLGEADRRGLDVVIDNLERVSALDGRPLGPAFPTSWMARTADLDAGFLLARDIPHHQRIGFGFCKPIFRRRALMDVVGGYDETLGCGEDVLALQTALLSGLRVGVVDAALYVYRVGEGSQSHHPRANRDLSRGNRLIARRLDAADRELEALAAYRQAALDLHGLQEALRARSLGDAAGFAARLPPGLLLGRALRTLGLRARPVAREQPLRLLDDAPRSYAFEGRGRPAPA